MPFPVSMSIYLAILLISAFLSLFVQFRKSTPSYLKYFTYFLLLTFVVEIVATILNLKEQDTAPLHGPFTAFEFVFYFSVLYQIIRNRTVRRIIRWTIILYPVVFLANILFWQGLNGFPHYTYLLGAFLVTGICAFYFNELMRMPFVPSLVREPAFWIASALFIYYGATLPLWASYHLMHGLSYKSLVILSTILMSLNYVLYSLFAVAFLCNLKPVKPVS